MPDSTSNVEILLRVRAENQAALTEMQAQINGLKAATAEATVSTAAWNSRMLEAAQVGQAWNASQTNLNATIGKTAANFAPASEAQKAFSLRAEEATINAASLARGGRSDG